MDSLTVVSIKACRYGGSVTTAVKLPDGSLKRYKVIGYLFALRPTRTGTAKGSVVEQRYVQCTTIFEFDGKQWMMPSGAIRNKIRTAVPYDAHRLGMFHTENRAFSVEEWDNLKSKPN